MSRLREILRPEAERRARFGAFAGWQYQRRPAFVDAHLDILANDLDANCRALAVARGLWKDCRWGVESAPRLRPWGSHWMLSTHEFAVVIYGKRLTRTAREIVNHDGHRTTLAPGLDAFTEQPQAMDACRCIWAALEQS